MTSLVNQWLLLCFGHPGDWDPSKHIHIHTNTHEGRKPTTWEAETYTCGKRESTHVGERAVYRWIKSWVIEWANRSSQANGHNLIVLEVTLLKRLVMNVQSLAHVCAENRFREGGTSFPLLVTCLYWVQPNLPWQTKIEVWLLP